MQGTQIQSNVQGKDEKTGFGKPEEYLCWDLDLLLMFLAVVELLIIVLIFMNTTIYIRCHLKTTLHLGIF